MSSKKTKTTTDTKKKASTKSDKAKTKTALEKIVHARHREIKWWEIRNMCEAYEQLYPIFKDEPEAVKIHNFFKTAICEEIGIQLDSPNVVNSQSTPDVVRVEESEDSE